MRIIRGRHKGKRITAPTRLPVRPTTDFAKEALFNVLEAHINWSEASVLDLFCGTGNISFECASRNAMAVLSVDKHFGCVRFVHQTAQQLEMNQIQAYKSDAFKFIEKASVTFDLIFADPPYALKSIPSLPDLIFEHQLLKTNGLFVLEHGQNVKFSDHPRLEDERQYGNVYFSLFR